MGVGSGSVLFSGVGAGKSQPGSATSNQNLKNRKKNLPVRHAFNHFNEFLQLVKPNEIVNQRLSLKEIGIGRMKQGPTVYWSRAIVRMGK